MTNVYIGLLHYPVYNKHREIIATCISNYDIHDIARTARCYGVCGYYIITPLPSQRELTKRIADHWLTGYGATFNPSRKEALLSLTVQPSLTHAEHHIATREGTEPKLVVTSRRIRKQVTSFDSMRQILQTTENTPFLLLFGTGWGLTDDILERADYNLEPIMTESDYNHFPVRGASAIILDRLLGDRSHGGKNNAGNSGN